MLLEKPFFFGNGEVYIHLFIVIQHGNKSNVLKSTAIKKKFGTIFSKFRTMIFNLQLVNTYYATLVLNKRILINWFTLTY